MSVSRMFLRAAAIAALSPMTNAKGEAEEGPTFARERVYDSRLDPLDHSADGSELPAIIVYTEDDDAVPRDKNSLSGAYDRTIILRVEIVIGSFEEVAMDGQTGMVFALPTTDAEMEARLDLFEQQVKWALLQLGWRPPTAVFMNFVKFVTNIKSVVVRDEATNNKLASRHLFFSCVVPDDCSPAISPEQSVAAKLDLTDFPGAPWLGQFLTTLSADPSASAVVNLLSNKQSAAVVLPYLRRMGVKVDAVKPEADPNLFKPGQTQGPEGRIEQSEVWNLP